jgi:hypothetical protein
MAAGHRVVIEPALLCKYVPPEDIALHTPD